MTLRPATRGSSAPWRVKLGLVVLTTVCGAVGAWLGLRDLLDHQGLLWVWGQVEVWNVALPTLLGLGIGWVLGALSFGPVVALRRMGPALAVNLVLLAGVSLFAWQKVRGEAHFVLPDRPAEDHVAREGRPDVFIFLLDAVRRDGMLTEDGKVLAAYPNFHAFAEESVTFASARSTAPWTVPGHASLFTGLNTIDHGASQETPFLVDDLNTLAEQMTAAGYRTVGIAANPWLSKNRGFAQGFEIYEEIWPTRERVPLIVEWAHHLGYWQPWSHHRRDKGTTAALHRFSEMIHAAPKDDPLFVFVNLISAHPVLSAPEPHDREMMTQPTLAMGTRVWDISQDWSELLTGEYQLSPEDLRVLQELYRGEIHFLDASVGRSFDLMRDLDRWDDAMVVLTSDHGCGLGEERHFGAGWDLHERMLQIPLVVKRPEGAGAGTTVFDPVQLNDVMPTVLRVAGAPAPQAPSDRFGHDLFGPEPRSTSTFAFARPMVMLTTLWMEHPRFDRTPWERRLFGVERDGWKMVWDSQHGYRLISLRDDPFEYGDQSEDRPALAAELRGELESLFGGTPQSRVPMLSRYGTGSGSVALDASTRESLQSLGYISGGQGN